MKYLVNKSVPTADRFIHIKTHRRLPSINLISICGQPKIIIAKLEETKTAIEIKYNNKISKETIENPRNNMTKIINQRFPPYQHCWILEPWSPSKCIPTVFVVKLRSVDLQPRKIILKNTQGLA